MHWDQGLRTALHGWKMTPIWPEYENFHVLWVSYVLALGVSSEGERERANGKGKGCKAIEEFKRRGGQDAEPYLYVDHNERRWDQ